MTHCIDLPADKFDRIFGPQLEPRRTGRARRCKVCGGWHATDRPWPDNCRQPRYTRQHLPAPQIAPTFTPFLAGDDGTYIGDRSDKREFMKREGVVEYDAGITNKPTWVDERREQDEFVEDWKAVEQMSKERRDELLAPGRAPLDPDTPAVSPDDIEVIE